MDAGNRLLSATPEGRRKQERELDAVTHGYCILDKNAAKNRQIWKPNFRETAFIRDCISIRSIEYNRKYTRTLCRSLG